MSCRICSLWRQYKYLVTGVTKTILLLYWLSILEKLYKINIKRNTDLSNIPAMYVSKPYDIYIKSALREKFSKLLHIF